MEDGRTRPADPGPGTRRTAVLGGGGAGALRTEQRSRGAGFSRRGREEPSAGPGLTVAHGRPSLLSHTTTGSGWMQRPGCLEAPCGVSHARKNIPRRGRRPRPCGRADVPGFCVVAGPVSASSRGLGVPSGNAGLGRMSRTTSGFFPETEVPVGRLAPCHSLRHSGV